MPLNNPAAPGSYTIPSYPPLARPLDGGEPFAAWQDGAQRAVPASAIGTFAAAGAVAAVQPAVASAAGSADRATVAAAQVAALMQGAVVTPPVEMLRVAAQTLCIDANARPAGGDMPHESIGPGFDYDGAGQWVWDSAWTAVAAAAMGQAARAQGWLLNWPSHQLANGMLPVTISTTKAQDNVAYSQPPVIARAVWACYQQTQDTPFLTAMLPCLKAWHGWWEAARGDASGLFSWGSSRQGASSDQVAQDARYESGQDANIGFYDPQYASVTGMVIDHCWPDLCAWLADAADHIALIAGALGAAADQATYQGKADAIRAAMNRLMWDDEQGCYLPVVRAELAASLGTVGANAAAGATSVTLSAATTRPIHKGAKIVLGPVVAQAGVDVQIGQTVIPLLVGLSGALASGTAATLRTLQYCKTLSNLTAPMLAGAPSQAQARRIVQEHVTYDFDGQTADTARVYLGADWGIGGNPTYLVKYNHYAVSAPNKGGGVTVKSDRWSAATNGDTVAQGFGRGTGSDLFRPYAFYRRDWEANSLSRPSVMTVNYFPSATSTGPQIVLTDDLTNSAIVNVIPAESGAPGVLSSVSTGPMTGGFIPYQMLVLRSNRGDNTGSIDFQSYDYSAQPYGFVWRTPTGLVANSRFSVTSIVLETNSDPANGMTPLSDYWRGDQWANLEYVTILALLRYGMAAEAADIARRVIARVAAELSRTGQMWERYSMRGQGEGSKAYAWTALVVAIAMAVGLG